MFANVIVLRTDLSWRSHIQRRAAACVGKITLDAYRNQELPIEEVLQALRVPRSLDRNPLFRVMFILQKGIFDKAGPGLDRSLHRGHLARAVRPLARTHR